MKSDTAEKIGILRQQVDDTMRGYAIDSFENQGLHGWRCRYPEIYGACTCYLDLLNKIAGICVPLLERISVLEESK